MIVATRKPMRLGVDPLDRRVNQADLEKSLYEVSVRLPDSVLQALYKSDLGQSISVASQDQNWWYRRVEHLVTEAQLAGFLPKDVKIEYKIGDWQTVYQSLVSGRHPDGQVRFGFVRRSIYTPLTVQVLLDLGANPNRGADMVVA